jgi:hypothetical protein
MNRSYTGVPSLKGLLLVGLLIFGGYQIFTAFSSRNWPEATGKVIGYDIQESYHFRGRGDYRSPYVFTPVVQYVYLVDHVSHEGKLKLQTFTSRNEAINYAGSVYHKGRHLQVLYNPKMPNLSTLTRSTI